MWRAGAPLLLIVILLIMIIVILLIPSGRLRNARASRTTQPM
jgi:hypothetical protein